jgi:hypothetical protein
MSSPQVWYYHLYIRSTGIIKILLQEVFQDTKGVIRIHKWKDRQHNGHTRGEHANHYSTDVEWLECY